jgi:hypothetical protein
MYYSSSCSYCGRLFYTFDNNKQDASKVLYEGIKAHLQSYGEDDKEHQFDEAPSIEEWQMFNTMSETSDPPHGGYELR